MNWSTWRVNITVSTNITVCPTWTCLTCDVTVETVTQFVAKHHKKQNSNTQEMLRYVSTQLTKLPGDLSNIWTNVGGEHCRLRRVRETETYRPMNKRDENTRRDQHHSWISRHIPDSHPTHTSPMDTPTIHQHSLHFPLNESTVQWQATSRNRWFAICHRVQEVGDDHLTTLVYMHCKPDQCGTFTEPFAWWLISLNIRCESKKAQAKINSTEKALTGVHVVLVANPPPASRALWSVPE